MAITTLAELFGFKWSVENSEHSLHSLQIIKMFRIELKYKFLNSHYLIQVTFYTFAYCYKIYFFSNSGLGKGIVGDVQ